MNSDTADWIIVIDDDITNLKIAGNILSKNGMRVTALNSGQALFDFIEKGNRPNLVLLDVLMPGMDGFETYERMRNYEDSVNIPEVPVIFLTAGEQKELEAKSLQLGALDFVKKPFEPNVLVQRIQNVLNHTRQIQTLSVEASTDKLTGLLNKASVNEYLKKMCNENNGALLVIDMDNFKLVNDLYGHEAGDRILVAFSTILKHHFRSHDIIGRIGGDEFVAFLKDLKDRDVLKRVAQGLNTKLHDAAIVQLGEDMQIPLGVSVGAIITQKGTVYSEAFKKADKSLYAVKQNGKHGCSVYIEEDSMVDLSKSDIKDLQKWNLILEERNVSNKALLLGQDNFANVYRYMIRYIRRYRKSAYKVLFTIVPHNDSIKEIELTEITEYFGEILASTLRNSDIMTHGAINQFLVLLPMVSEESVHAVIDRVMDEWKKTQYYDRMSIEYESEAVV